MDIETNLRETAARLSSTDDLRRSGMSESDITRATRAGSLVRLRPGWHLDGDYWSTAPASLRHLAAILAAQRSADAPPAYSHLSAAALHGLPAWSNWLRFGLGDSDSDSDSPGPDPRTVHATLRGPTRASSSQSLIRHRSQLSPTDIETRFGLTLTTPERTLADLARTEPFAVALACADAYLRDIARVARKVDNSTVAFWREDMTRRANLLERSSGTRAVRALAELADPLADSPLETTSRLRFHQLGITVRLQSPVPRPGGGTLFLDFELEGLGFWGEADGKQKYLDRSLRGGRTADEVVYAEKRRSDWIAGSTGLRPIRWGAREVSSLEAFAEHLRAHGVPLPTSPRSTWSPGTAAFLRTLP